MRTSVILVNIDSPKVATAQKSGPEGPGESITTITFCARVHPITLMRLHSLMGQKVGIDVTFASRQATFDWQADPGMDVIRKIHEEQAELGLPKTDLLVVPLFSQPAPDAPTEEGEAVTETPAGDTETAPDDTAEPGFDAEAPKASVKYAVDGTPGESLCRSCLTFGSQDCAAPETFSEAVQITACTSYKQKPAGGLDETMPVAATEPDGNGNGHSKTRYIPGKGRRKTAKAG